MRIGLLTTSFPRHSDDIAGNFVLGFAKALSDRGHKLEVLAPEPAGGGIPPAWRNISVRWVPYLRPRWLQRTFYGHGVPDNLRHDPLAWAGIAPFALSLYRLARQSSGRWDAVISHWALPCSLAAGPSTPRRPHLAVLHSADVHLLRRLPARRLWARRIARSAGKLLFVSPGLRDDFIGFLPSEMRSETASRSRVLSMGIEPAAETAETRDELRRLAGFDRFTLLFVGRLIRLKGVDLAIQALRGRRDIELVVAGDGPERRSLQRLAERSGTRVRFLGTVVGQQKTGLLRSADAFLTCSRILPSGRTEGMPTSLLEALAHGLPIVAADVGGIGSVLVDGESALLIPPSQPEAIIAAVDRLVADEALRERLGRCGREAASRHTWPVLAPVIERLLT